jgi:hypothetical protein
LQVQFPKVLLEFFINIILPATLWSWGWLNLQKKWVPGIFPVGWRWLVHRADNPTTFMYRLSWNLGASTSWNTQGLRRHVKELLCFFIKHYAHKTHLNLVHDMLFLTAPSVLVYKKMFLT